MLRRHAGNKSGQVGSVVRRFAVLGALLVSGCSTEHASGVTGGATGSTASGSEGGAGGETSASSTSSTATGVGGETGGAGTGGACDPGETKCGAGCVNIETDLANCGSCGHPCAAGASCAAGACGTAVCTGAIGLPGPPLVQVPMKYLHIYGPAAMAEGDVNGDGQLDLVLATQDPGGLTVVLNQGNGTFAPPITMSETWSPTSVALAELNGDGKIDLIVTGYLDKTNVFLGHGDGTFAAPVGYEPSASKAVAVADLNGDGHTDIGVAAGSFAYILINHGDGTFASPVYYSSTSFTNMMTGPTGGLYSHGLVFGDVNGDGHPDLVVAYEGNYADPVQGVTRDLVSVFLNLGNGTFGPAVDYEASVAPQFVTLGDFNGDGKLDLAVANQGDPKSYASKVPGSEVSILLNQGSGTFGTAVNYFVGNWPNSLATADVNGDGKLDLVAANSGSHMGGGNLSTLINQGNGTFAPAAHWKVGGLPFSVAAGDLNGDGKPDLADANITSGTLSVLLNQGNGGFLVPDTYPAGASTSDLIVADLDGDGRPDLAGSSPYSSDVIVLRNQGNGTFAAGVGYALADAPSVLAAGDLNGDGKLDLVGAGNGASLLFNQGDGTFSAGININVGSHPNSIALADLNDDGKIDLISSSFTKVSVLLNAGGGVFAAPVEYSVASTSNNVVVGDLNGDGKLDLAIGAQEGQGSTTISILLNLGGGVFGAAILYKVAYPPDAIALGDIDGDGKLDLAFTGYDTNPVGSAHVGVLLNQGNGAFAPSPTTYPVPDGSRSIALGDLNGDGRPDLLVGTVHGMISVLLNQGNATFGPVIDYSGGTSSIAVADLDGDGALDLATADGAAVVLLNRCLP